MGFIGKTLVVSAIAGTGYLVFKYKKQNEIADIAKDIYSKASADARTFIDGQRNKGV